MISTREGTKSKVGRTAGGITSLEGQLSSAWTCDVFTHIFTHVFTRVLSSQQRKQLTRSYRAGHLWTNSYSCNQTRLGSGDSQYNSGRLVDHFQTAGHLKCTVKRCIWNLLKIKRGFERTPSNPPPGYGPVRPPACLWTRLHVFGHV